MRPKSIVRYELFYLAAVALAVANEALNWKITNSPRVQAALGPSFMPIFLTFVYTLSLFLWYFTARSPSAFARWAVVGLFALSLVGFVATVATGRLPGDIGSALRIGALACNAIAVWLLFRPDASTWFGNRA